MRDKMVISISSSKVSQILRYYESYTGMISHMGLQMTTHGLMPNVPIGVPPPNMQSLLGPPGMMQTMLTPSVNPPFGAGVGVSLLTQIPLPAPAAPSDKPNSTGMYNSLTLINNKKVKMSLKTLVINTLFHI